GFLFLAAGAPVIVFGIIGSVVVAILFFLGAFVYASRHVRFELSSEGLAIRGDLYGRRLPAASLLTAQARVVDLTRDGDYRLVARTNGVGFPGYGSGWFQLANGDKALIFVTDKRRVVYLPTREGYALLLSLAEPDKFLGALRQMSP
ncbi:MAG TPA: PH domain-containing protein, partial [Desulfobaccales bacterium]